MNILKIGYFLIQTDFRIADYNDLNMYYKQLLKKQL